jgi:hypothetical protein
MTAIGRFPRHITQFSIVPKAAARQKQKQSFKDPGVQGIAGSLA